MPVSTQQTLEIKVPSNPEDLSILRFFIAGIGHVFHLNLALIEDLKLAVMEGSYLLLEEASTNGSHIRLQVYNPDDSIRLVLSLLGSQSIHTEFLHDNEEQKQPELGKIILENLMDGVEFDYQGTPPKIKMKLSLSAQKEPSL